MSRTQSLSITLSGEMARMLKNKVASGEYATESEVIRDGLRALQERDAAVEHWLREEVAPTYRAYLAAPSETIGLDEAMAEIRAIAAADAQAKPPRA